MGIVPAIAQTGQGSMNGRVTDPSGSLVPNADVVITNVETDEVLRTKTNASGSYSVQSLNPGTYRVEISAPGFQTLITDKVLVSAAQDVETSAKLAMGNESVSVTVTSQDSLLEKSTDVSTTVDHELVENLPYPERSSLEAVLLIPGIEGDPTQPGGISTENPGYLTGQVTPGASIRIGGAPPGTHAQLIDGSDVIQSSYPRSGLNLSGVAVQETTAITTGLSAKYGRTGSGVIIQTTRTGSDQYHGVLSWQHTDPFFNAYPLGGTEPNDIHQNFYGASVGGPVRIPKIYNGRDRTFFHVDVEPARLRNFIGVRGLFLTDDEAAGRLALSQSTGGTTVDEFHSTLNAQGFPNGPDTSSQYRPIVGPISDCPSAYLALHPTATSCPNDLVPQLAQNAFAQYVFSQEPTPSHPGPYVQFDPNPTVPDADGNNANYERGVFNHDDRYNIRIDHQISSRSQVFVRYTAIPILATRFFAIPTTNPLSQAPTDHTVSRDVAIGYTHVLSNNLVANFRYSWLRVNQTRFENYSSLTEDFAAQYGLTPATWGKGFPNLGTFDNETLKPGSLTALAALDQNFIVGQDFNYTHGTHLIQFGGEYRWIQSNQQDLSRVTGGIYAFDNTQTGNGSSGGSSIATFILGTVSSFSNSPQPITEYYRWRYFALYAQDDWRVSAKLTANIGLRYNVETPRIEKFNNQGSIVFQAGTVTGPNVLNGAQPAAAGFCFSGTCGLPTTLWPTNWASVEPRVGLAYGLLPSVVLRGSFMLTHLPLTGYDNVPRTDFDPGTAVSYNSGGQNPAWLTNYVSNPAAPPSSGYAAFNPLRGQPNYTSNTISPDYVHQVNSVPYTEGWAASVQYQPAPKSIIQLAYQGSHGVHLIGSFSQPLNAPSIAEVTAAIQSNQYLDQKFNNPYGVLSSNNAVVSETRFQGLNPYQNFFNQNLYEIFPRTGSMHYNAFYASFNQRFSRHVTFLSSYVWSKTLDNIPDTTGGSEGGFGIASDQDQDNPGNEWSVASYDFPSRFRTGFHVVLPLGPTEKFRTHWKPLDYILSDITTSGIITSSSGHPNTITLGGDGYFYSITPPGVNGCATGSKYCTLAALPAGITLRPNIVPGQPIINANWKSKPFGNAKIGAAAPYLNPAAFSVPGSQGNPQLGTAPRTLANGRTPREFLFDARVTKSIRIRERYQLELTATANNVLNHPVYFQIDTTAAFATPNVSTSSGLITQGHNSGFANLDTSSTSALSRVLRVGAQFRF